MYNLICKLRNIIGFFLAVLNCFAFAKLRPVVTIETAKTAEMVAINNRPRRRIGLNGHKGLNKTP